MDFSQHYNIISGLHQESPKFVKKNSYTINYSVNVNHFRPTLKSYIKMSPLSEEFKKVESNYKDKIFKSTVEEFYLTSNAGNNIFIAAFSDSGIKEKNAEAVLRRSSFNLFYERLAEARKSNLKTAEFLWATTLKWQTLKNPSDISDSNIEILFSEQNKDLTLLALELIIILPEKYHNDVKTYNFTSMDDIFQKFNDGMLDVDFMSRITNRYWLWNDHYFYTEFSEPYRYLAHPHMPAKNYFDLALDFNIKASRANKNINTSVFIPQIISVEAIDENSACVRCGNSSALLMRTGYNINVYESLCAQCVESYHSTRKQVINHTADYPSDVASIYSLLLQDKTYGILSEKQLINLALDFPDFKTEILEAKNVTDNVRSALALNHKNNSPYI
jgi:hypothetical protein